MNRIYIYGEVQVEETVEDMLKSYNIALSDKKAKMKLLNNLKSDYFKTKNELFEDIQAACQAAKRLEEISLGKKSLLSSVAYIERLIDSERRSNRPNKKNRLEQLMVFREKAKMLEAARQGPEKFLNEMAVGKYEVTVMQAISNAETEDDVDDDDESNNNNETIFSKVAQTVKDAIFS